jgi:hypothetical protein
MLKKLPSENGQALILMVLSFVGLLGMTALAIDGGKIYAERRYVQNRADAASVAGAAAASGHFKKIQESNGDSVGTTATDWDCGSNNVSDAIEIADAQARTNLLQPENNIVATEVGVNVDINVTCSQEHKHIDVEVEILFDSQTSFMHFVYDGIAQNRVRAITRVLPTSPVASGFAIATLDETCQSSTERGIRFAGTGGSKLEVNINGGGIFSNSCIVVDGETSDVAVTINGGSATFHESKEPYKGGNAIYPEPQSVPYRIDPYIPPPNCVGELDPAYSTDSDGNRVYRPGRYTNDLNVTSGSVILKPGLYCFDTNNAKFNVTSNLTGDGVTFYFTETAGSFSTEGNGLVKLFAPSKPCDVNEPGYSDVDCNPAVPGLLIYFHDGNTKTIKIGGTSDSEYTGTIYARKSHVMIGGTSGNISLGVQVIANSVKVHGSATILMTYDDSLIYQTPNMINLER